MKLPKTILVLAPHTDDGEFGCGGTIAKFIERGAKVIYVAFSTSDQSVLPNYPSDILHTEALQATKTLGIKETDCLLLDFEVRRFPEFRQKILDQMIELNDRFQPDIVFLPSIKDTHQDHQTIANEGFRAFKKTTMLGYELPWNNIEFRTSCFVEISETNLNTKIFAILKYKSQKHKPYSDPSFIRSLAVTRGVQISKKFAESFEVIRWII